MKNITKNILSAVLICFIVSGCNQTDLDLTVSPNDLAADQSDPNLLLNSMQIAYAANQEALSGLGGELTRLEYFFGRDYFNSLPGSTLDFIWRRTYSSAPTFNIGDSGTNGASVGIQTNLQALEQINADTDLNLGFHIGVGKTLYAHSLFQLADYVGEAAFSQAGNPDFPAPLLDDGESIYAAAFTLLSEAEALLAENPPTSGAQDFFYGGNSAQWIKLINTIRLRSYVLTGDKASFDAIIAGDNYISSSADDFQLQFGTSALQPDNRHPDYQDDYKDDGAEIYQSNWLMNLMLMTGDPRIKYYFYRQSSSVPGATELDGTTNDPNEETLACSLVVPPPHYDGYVFCAVANGYWGRSHGNDEGTPPDGFQRTASGVYPAAGKFDDNSFGVVGLGVGGGGAGIEPIILSSYVDFWQGIMAGSAGEKSGFLRSGLMKSIEKVQSFGALDGAADLSTAPSADDVTEYIDGIVTAFDAASGDDQENIFAEQYFVTLFGGSTEAYNYYRLTGYPTTVAPNWEPDPGPFPRSYLTPQTEVINNPNISQKADLTTQVFWDTNPPSPAFPPAN